MSAGLSPASPSQHQSSLTAGGIPASPLQGCMILRMELGLGVGVEGVRAEGGLDPLPPTRLRPCSNLNLRVVSFPCLAPIYCAMLCYAVLCCAMLCYAMLYYAMLCDATLCRTMLYCAVLCCPAALMLSRSPQTHSLTCSLTNSSTQSITHSGVVFFPLALRQAPGQCAG